MTSVTGRTILALSALCAFITACGSGPANSNAVSNAAANQVTRSAEARTNVEELGMLINVPYESEEAFWKEDQPRRSVVAVLRFPAVESSRLVADAEKVQAPQPAVITPENWFPPELIAQGDLSGDDSLKGTSYSAAAFYNPPYNAGRIVRIENSDYFVLELSSK
jgi:hypothetical protein